MVLPPDRGKAARELLLRVATDYLRVHPSASRTDVGQHVLNRITQPDASALERKAGQELMAICLYGTVHQIVGQVLPRRHD